MKRNSGLIGPLTNAVITAAPGVFDTFDAYNFRKNGNWPLSFGYNSLSTNSGTILENSVINLAFNTSGFEVNTTLYWNILHITTGNTDFFGSTASGSFTQNAPSNSGTFSIITALIGDTSKSSRTFKIEIRTGSPSGPVVYTSGTFNIPAITSTVSWTVTPVNEGSNTNLQVFLGNVGSYTTYVANIAYTGTAGAFDFNNLPSSINIGSGTFTVIYSALADLTTEGTETLTATVRFGASSFLLGNPTLTISDISTNASATVTPTLTSVNEDGTAVTFNVSTTGFTSGTIYWTVLGISGTLNSADFNQGNVGGSFNVTDSAGSFVLNIAADAATEGTETFQVQIRTASTSGTVIGTSATITIADTSLGASATVTPTLTSVNEDGTAVTFNVSTINFTSGTLYWTVLGISGTLITTDFTQGATAGNFNVTNSAGSFVLNIAADATTEGTESFQVQVRTASTSGLVIGTSGTITIADTSLTPGAPSYITLGTRAPYFSAGGYSIFPPTGYTSLANGSVDDGNVNCTTPFSIVINGTSYSTHYFGSNTYITWGSGSNNYSGLNATNPPFNKLMLGAADNSYQRVSTTTAGTLYTRVRYEGNGGTGGSVGSPGIVLEVTFFNPANYGGVPVIEVLVGNHNRTTGVTGIYTSSTSMLTWSSTPNLAYVLVGNATGTTWTRYLGYINNSGY